MDGLRVASDTEIPLAEVELRASRSSGPGGQHANVTASRVEARFDVEGSQSLDDDQKRRVLARLGPVVRATAQDTRSQARNRELALERLRARIESALRERRPRKSTRPPKAAHQRRVERKRRRGQLKKLRERPGRDE